MTKKILLTGGAGYIGSHTYLALINSGFDIVIADNFSNSSQSVISALEKLTQKPVSFLDIDVRNLKQLDNLFAVENFDAVVHFAALKSVSESVLKPIDYFDNNLIGLINILKIMDKHSVKKIVFSSSATVYGDAEVVPTQETADTSYINPYAYTKLSGEQILQQLYDGENDWHVGILRYFNPVGANPSGLIGESPNDIPNNLMPYIAKVAIGELPYLTIFGNDYDTPDGTGVRDYIHVTDLAAAHLQSLNFLFSKEESHIVNIGTGIGHSVLEVLKAYEKACGKTLNYKVASRRPGDVPISLASTQKAKELFDFETKFSLDDMCRHSWNWISSK